MAGGHGALPSDPVARALARAHGILPDQGPIGVFVHHNTLHAFQHQPFFDGIEAGAALLGARPYLPLAAFRAAWRTGRVADDDVRTEIARTLGDGARVAVAPGLSMAALWHTLMTADVHEDAEDAAGLTFAVDAGTAPESRDRGLWAACLARVVHHGPPPPAEPLPAPRRHRDVLLALGAGDTDVAVHAELVRLGAGFLDQGQAHTVLPARERGFLAAVSRRLAAAGLSPASNLPFDAAAWHWYVYPSLLQTGPDRARQLLIQAGLPERPIWVTELGVPIWNEHPGPCWDPISPWRATATEQAAYLWQAFAESLASRVAAVFFFQLYDDCGNGPTSYDAFGLLRNHASNQCWTPPEGRACWPRDPALDGRPRPGFHALAAWSRELAGASLLWRPPREDNFTQRILFFRPPDSRVTVLWNLLRSEQTLAFFATGPAGTLWRLGPNGLVQSTALGPVGGRYSIALAGATNRNNPGNQAAVMAGPPQILVERDTAAPFRSLVDALPERSPRSFELKVRAADGGTGVGSFELLGASGDCSAPVGWRILTSGPWTADPLAGDVAWRVEGLPGQRLCFAARAADRAGNWTAAPSAPQAVTMIEDGLPSATAGASASTTPSAWPPTPPPSATATAEASATATPGPGPTVTETAVSTPTVTAEPLATATRPSAMGPALYLPWLRAGTPADGAAAGTETRRPDR
jgi:hypothetical protein